MAAADNITTFLIRHVLLLQLQGRASLTINLAIKAQVKSAKSSIDGGLNCNRWSTMIILPSIIREKRVKLPCLIERLAVFSLKRVQFDITHWQLEFYLLD